MKYLKIFEGFNDHSDDITINIGITKSQFMSAYLEKNPNASEEAVEIAISEFDDWMQNTLENAGINVEDELFQFLNQ